MNLLLVTYEFPPKGGVGVQRPLKTARYLAEAGCDVTVLTVADPPASVWDPGLLRELPASVAVKRAWSLEPTRLLQALHRRSGRQANDGPAQAFRSGERGLSRLPRWVIRGVQAFFIPDEKYWWTPFAVRLARRLHDQKPFDCILASGPPFTALGVARRASRDLAVPWVADLRDPLVGGYFFTPITPLHDALMRAYERRVVGAAARVITVTDGMRRDLSARYPDAQERLLTVPNGFDPTDFEGAAPPLLPHFTLSYIGAFQGEIRADRLLGAVARACEMDRAFAADVRVRLVGPKDSETARAIDRHGLQGLVETLGFVGHADAVLEMRRATVLVLLLGPGTGSASILTGKLPEYLAAGRPIFALVPDGEAARLVRRAGAGWVVHPSAVDGAALTILEAYERWRRGTLPAPDQRVVAEFDRRQLVGRVRGLLEEVVADDNST